jgi:hypothetical protein
MWLLERFRLADGTCELDGPSIEVERLDFGPHPSNEREGLGEVPHGITG